MKKILLILPFLLVALTVFGINIRITWNPQTIQPTFYTLYWGNSSYNYTNSINVQTNECTVSNLQANTIYYFAGTETIGTSTSLYSVQLVVGPNPVSTNQLYIGDELVYGNSLSTLETNFVELESFNGYNQNTYFAGSLVINANPFFNMNSAGDNATYLAEQISWGPSLSSITVDTIPVFTDLNIGDYFSSSLIITNQSF
jgi:hypothetical protein